MSNQGTLITEKEREKIFKLKSLGLSIGCISERMGRSDKAISHILNRAGITSKSGPRAYQEV